MRSFVTLALALAASLTPAAALADHNSHNRGDRYVADTADELRLAAESLVRSLGRERDPSTVHLIHASGMLAKESADLACAAGLRLQSCLRVSNVRVEFQDVKAAFQRLKQQVRQCGRLGSRSEDLYQDVVYAWQDLRDAVQGGRDPRDDGYDDDGYDDDGYDDDGYNDDDYDDDGGDLDDYDDFYPDEPGNGPAHGRDD
jgi:hypothetical protein